MSKKSLLLHRKRTCELQSTPDVTLDKKAVLAKLRTEVESSHQAVTSAIFTPMQASSTTISTDLPQPQISQHFEAEEIIQALVVYAEQLQIHSHPKHHTGTNEKKNLLLQQVATYINQRAEHLNQRGILGKAKKMQCEALLHAITNGLKKRNIELPKVRLSEHH